MSGLVESAIYRSVLALVEKDREQANLVLQNESRINQIEIEIDDQATRLLALDQPVATDLRLITAIIKINSNLERMGDLAVNIVERALSLMHEPMLNSVVDISHMANLVESMVGKVLDSFVHKDSEQAFYPMTPSTKRGILSTGSSSAICSTTRAVSRRGSTSFLWRAASSALPTTLRTSPKMSCSSWKAWTSAITPKSGSSIAGWPRTSSLLASCPLTSRRGSCLKPAFQ